MAQRKLIAFVSNTSWSIYNFRLGVIKHLQELNFDVLIVAPRDNYSAKLLAEGVSFESVRMNNYGTNVFADFNTLRQLRRIYKKHQPDFIFHYTIKPNVYGSIASALCRIPSIAITTGLGHFIAYRNPLVRLGSFHLYRLAAFLSEQVWFLNQDDKNIFIQKRILSEKKTFLLPGEGIDIQRFKPDHFGQQISTSKPLVFLYAGRVLWDKGVKEYVEAAQQVKRRYPDAVFQILGFIDPNNPNAVPFHQIEKWNKAGIIQYLGETDDVRPFIQDADCLVFPSFYREGMSRILLEAASMACPIITTDNVGCREVVEHGVNGYLCRPRESSDLARRIKQLIKLSPKDRFLMGLNGRKKVIQEFDETRIIKYYVDTLSRFLNIKSKSKQSQFKEQH